MANKFEYKFIYGADDEIVKKLAEATKDGWKPILLSSVLTGLVVRSNIILERVTKD